MRIVSLVNNSLARDGRVQRQVHALAAAGYDVHVVGVLSDRDDDVRGLKRANGVTYHWVDRRRRGNLRARCGWVVSVADRAAARTLYSLGIRPFSVAARLVGPTYRLLARAAGRLGGDLYIANDLNTLPSAWIAAGKRGAMVGYDIHELYREEDPRIDNTLRAAIVQIERELLPKVAFATTVSPLIGCILQLDCQPRHPIQLVRNVPQLTTSAPVMRRSGPLKFLIHSANLSAKAQGIPELIRVLGRHEQTRSCEIHLRGRLTRATEEQAIQSLAVEASFPLQNLFIHPPATADDLVSLASACDVGVVAYAPDSISKLLTIPNRVFEYMMAGLAIVTLPYPGVRAIVEEERCGVVASDFDDTALESAIGKLLVGEHELINLRERARCAAVMKYNWGCEQQHLLRVVAALGDGS